MKALGVIPARYASSRFPGKPLCVIRGKTMIRRVVEQAQQCPDLTAVVVATDHHLIEQHVKEFSGQVIMTSPAHKSGTERCAEALARYLEDRDATPVDIVVNIQGDEPFIRPEQISEVITCFQDPSTPIATLARRIRNSADLADPHVVKVVFTRDHQVLYFSRSPVPYFREPSLREPAGPGQCYEHVGIYGFRTDALLRLVKLPETWLETAESLEQLRWLEHGYPIKIHVTEYPGISIDTPADLEKIPDTFR